MTAYAGLRRRVTVGVAALVLGASSVGLASRDDLEWPRAAATGTSEAEVTAWGGAIFFRWVGNMHRTPRCLGPYCGPLTPGPVA